MSYVSKMRQRAYGDLVADYGTLPSDIHGCRVAVTLWKHESETPYLRFRWELADGQTILTSLECTPKVYEQLDTIIRESRKRVEIDVA
jgi:hypothetical protein